MKQEKISYICSSGATCSWVIFCLLWCPIIEKKNNISQFLRKRLFLLLLVNRRIRTSGMEDLQHSGRDANVYTTPFFALSLTSCHINHSQIINSYNLDNHFWATSMSQVCKWCLHYLPVWILWLQYLILCLIGKHIFIFDQ